MEYGLLLLIGIVTGSLAWKLIEGGESGVIANIVIAVAGAFAGGLLAPRLGISIAGGGMADILIIGLAGSLVFAFLGRLIFK